MSVATASAVLRVRLTSTISRALLRVTAASAMAQPTLPVPTTPSFMGFAFFGLVSWGFLGLLRCRAPITISRRGLRSLFHGGQTHVGHPSRHGNFRQGCAQPGFLYACHRLSLCPEDGEIWRSRHPLSSFRRTR